MCTFPCPEPQQGLGARTALGTAAGRVRVERWCPLGVAEAEDPCATARALQCLCSVCPAQLSPRGQGAVQTPAPCSQQVTTSLGRWVPAACPKCAFPGYKNENETRPQVSRRGARMEAKRIQSGRPDDSPRWGLCWRCW